MDTRRNTIVLYLLLMTIGAFGQLSSEPMASVILVKDGQTTSKETTTTLPKTYYHHYRLSGTYTGLMIEIASSELPMERTNPLFRQFGKVYYDKLDEGGYSYVITTDFTHKKSLRKFFERVIQPKITSARMIEYRSGKRYIL